MAKSRPEPEPLPEDDEAEAVPGKAGGVYGAAKWLLMGLSAVACLLALGQNTADGIVSYLAAGGVLLGFARLMQVEQHRAG